MRARNIKPAVYKNEVLAECSVAARWLFTGLWCLADREGRLEDRPKRIRAEIFPYENPDVDGLLEELVEHGFILRYRIGEARYIQVCTFSKHQSPHQNEADSVIPSPWSEDSGNGARASDHGESAPQVLAEHSPSARADCLIADSLIVDKRVSQMLPSAEASGNTPLDVSGNRVTLSAEETSVKRKASSKPDPGEDVPEYLELCKLLRGWVETNHPRETINDREWPRYIRLIVERKKFSVQEVRDVIEWTQQHSFWWKNVRAARKLYRNWAEIWAQYEAERGRQQSGDSSRSTSGGRSPNGQTNGGGLYAQFEPNVIQPSAPAQPWSPYRGKTLAKLRRDATRDDWWGDDCRRTLDDNGIPREPESERERQQLAEIEPLPWEATGPAYVPGQHEPPKPEPEPERKRTRYADL